MPLEEKEICDHFLLASVLENPTASTVLLTPLKSKRRLLHVTVNVVSCEERMHNKTVTKVVCRKFDLQWA